MSRIKERGISFSPEMVRAVLDGTKTQTRRMVKDVPMFSEDYDRKWHPHVCAPCEDLPAWSWWEGPAHGPSLYHTTKCPYGVVGDRLWVKETWAWLNDEPEPPYRTPSYDFITWRAAYDERSTDKIPWKSPRFMPRWASRITLEIQEVRVERLKDISPQDISEEGVQTPGEAMWGREWWLGAPDKAIQDARECFKRVWENINGAGSWDASPWVWAITFKRVATTEVGE